MHPASPLIGDKNFAASLLHEDEKLLLQPQNPPLGLIAMIFIRLFKGEFTTSRPAPTANSRLAPQ
jgi:hypothetical protein